MGGGMQIMHYIGDGRLPRVYWMQFSRTRSVQRTANTMEEGATFSVETVARHGRLGPMPLLFAMLIHAQSAGNIKA